MMASADGYVEGRPAAFASIDKQAKVHIDDHDNDQEQEQRREILHQDLLNRTLQDAGQFSLHMARKWWNFGCGMPP